MNKYKRNCSNPDCNKELFYSNLGNLNFAIKNNKICRSCAKSKPRKYFQKEFIHICPKCNGNVVFDKYRSWYYAEKNNHKCKNCQSGKKMPDEFKEKTRKRQLGCNNSFYNKKHSDESKN